MAYTSFDEIHTHCLVLFMWMQEKIIERKNGDVSIYFFLVTNLRLGNAPVLRALACRDAKRELVAALRYVAGAT
jgi:hypothetical protein